MSARTFHYIPFANERSGAAVAHFTTLESHLRQWIVDAMAGLKPGRLSATSQPALPRTTDEIRCDIAQVLAAATEWDGFTIAHLLKLRGWPADVELVQLCNAWSCGILRQVLDEKRARKEAAKQGGKA